MQVGNGGTTGQLGAGAVVDNAALVFNRSDALVVANVISGTGTITQAGTGTTTLTGTNTYSGTTTISAGTLQVGSGGTTGQLGTGAVVDNAALTFNRSNALTVANAISGTGSLTQAGTGTLTLSGNSTYSGTTSVNAGTLRVNGSLGNTAVTVGGGAMLGGAGSISGPVTLASGATLAPGTSPGTLTVGSLTLSSGSALDYELNTPFVVGSGVNDLVVVTGNLTLDGTLNVTDVGSFGAGAYTLMTYGGTLIDQDLAFGLLPTGFNYQVQAGGGSVSLVVSPAGSGFTQFWDGAGPSSNGVANGGAGIWTASAINWTYADGAANTNWQGQRGVFQGAPGTVTVVGPITFTGLEFNTSGYSLLAGNGGSLNIGSPDTVISSSPGVTTTIDVPITGTGGIDLQGSGTLILTASNQYSGGTVVGTTSTLQIGNGGTGGGIAGNVTNNGTLAFNRSSSVTLGGAISGSGVVRQDGPGTLVLSGTNSYTGGTVVGAGILSVSADANLGGPTGALTLNGGTLLTTASFASARPVALAGPFGTISTAGGTTFDLSGPVSGAGTLVKTGNGTLVLSGANSYAAGTIIGGGTLSISSDANLGAASGHLTIDGGTLQTSATFSSSRATTLGPKGGTVKTASGTSFTLRAGVDGPGSLTKTGAGRLTLVGASSYAGGTTIKAGTLQLGNCGTTGSIRGNVRDDSVLVFSRSNTYAFAGAISGSGAVVKNCKGTTILTGANSYRGGTRVTDGVLQGTSRSLQGRIANDAVVIFDQQAAGTFSGVMSGSGTLVKDGDGTLIVTGANSYKGGTVIRAGILQGDAGSLQGEILDNAALVFDQSTDAVFRGTLFGDGSVTKRGNGTLLFTGEHGFQGLTHVEEGTLALDGMLAGSVDVRVSAVLDATGFIGGALTVGGTVTVRSLPDSGFGTLVLGGNLRLGAGSQYGVRINADGDNSRLMVAGSATIDGATVAIDAQPGSYGRVTQYAVLQADGGLTGHATTTSNTATLEPWLTRTDSTLFVTLLRTDLPLQPYATTTNGSAVGYAFDRLRPGATGDLANVMRELTALDDAALATALDAVSGEIHASGLQLAALDGEGVMDLVRDEIARRASPRELGADTQTPPSSPQSRRRHVWSQLHGQRASFDAASSAHGGDANFHGFALGVDWPLRDRWLVGVGGAYATGKLTLDGLAESSDFTAPRALGYIGYAHNRWMAHVGASIARAVYDTRRTLRFAARTPLGDDLLFGGVNRQATSAPSGLATEVWAQERLDTRIGSWFFFPSVGLRYARYGRRAWTEEGADALSLAAPDQTFSSKQADVGLWLGRAMGRFRPDASVLYRRGLGDRQTTARLELSGLGDGSFVVDGLPLARDTLVGRTGLTVWTQSVRVALAYEIQRAQRQLRQAIQFSLGFE